MFIDLHMLKQLCDTGVNEIWSWCMILLCVVGFGFFYLQLRIFASIFIEDIGLQFSFFGRVFLCVFFKVLIEFVTILLLFYVLVSCL